MSVQNYDGSVCANTVYCQLLRSNKILMEIKIIYTIPYVIVSLIGIIIFSVKKIFLMY